VKLLDPETGTCNHIVRAHPDYRREGCWYDYVEIDYGEDGLFPARCAIFFQWPLNLKIPLDDVDFEGVGSTNELLGLFQQCHFQNAQELGQNSLLFSHWRLQHHTSGRSSNGAHKCSAKFVCLPPGAINRRIFAIDPTPGDGGPFHRVQSNTFNIIRVEDRQLEWPNRYLMSHQNWETINNSSNSRRKR
jgi:hypothetical protein